jgi:RNA polymerase sigma-70 factor (ECF subfamily)
VVLEAGKSHDGDRALNDLCQAYWQPVYAFVRTRGYQEVDAEDLTQSFFLTLIKTRSFRMADPRKGKFRFFLLTVLKHFLANEWKYRQRLKRGGAVRLVSLEETANGDNSLEDPAIASSSLNDRLFDKRWGETLVAIVFDRLREEYDRKGKLPLYRRLIVHLSEHGNSKSYEETAKDLALSLSAVKSAIHRLRHRYGCLFREEIARTVAQKSDIEDEIQYIINSLSS